MTLWISSAPKWNTSACARGEVDESPMSHSRPVFGSYLTHAPGDFFLISRRTLTKIRGYPQIPHIDHVDTWFVYAAAAHGLTQLVMKPACSIYHQEHTRSAVSHAETLPFLYDFVLLCSDLLMAGSRANHRSENTTTAAGGYESLEFHHTGIMATGVGPRIY